MQAVLQEVLALPQTPSSLISLLTEKLLAIIPDEQRHVQTVRFTFRRFIYDADDLSL